MKFSVYFPRVILMLLPVIFTACTKKPPDCSDASDALYHAMTNKITTELTYQHIGKQDGENIIKTFLDTWKFSLSNITTNGYDEQSRTRSCKAKVTVQIPKMDKPSETDVTYNMQTFEDTKSGTFQLSTDSAFPIWSGNHVNLVQDYYYVNRMHGIWTGASQCAQTHITSNISLITGPGGLEDANKGFTVIKALNPWAADDFTSFPVTLEIKDSQVSMKIKKPDGSFVIRNGKMDSRFYGTPKSNFKLNSHDELSTLVSDQMYFENDSNQLKSPGDGMSTNAVVKINATEQEGEVTIGRICTLKLTQMTGK